MKNSLYQIGDTLRGKITGIQPYGLFVSLKDKKQGLIHISECDHGFVDNLSTRFSVGQTVQVQVIDVDPFDGKISLSLRSLKKTNTPNYPKRWSAKQQKKEGNGFEALALAMPHMIQDGLHIEEEK